MGIDLAECLYPCVMKLLIIYDAVYKFFAFGNRGSAGFDKGNAAARDFLVADFAFNRKPKTVAGAVVYKLSFYKISQ